MGISNASKEHTIISTKGTGGPKAPIKKENNAPLALIIEPSKELAEQTFKQVQNFKKHLHSPNIKELLIIAGTPLKDQITALENGVDIVVATPGRLDDLISQQKLSLKQVRFFILDEVDGLLSQGQSNMINRIKGMIPQVSCDGRRLQMIVCSATLHNFEVKKLAEKIMYFPTWVDLKGLNLPLSYFNIFFGFIFCSLKGQDSVPDTIHHCVCVIDPKIDTEWRNMNRHVVTDGVHSTDRLNYQSESKGMI